MSVPESEWASLPAPPPHLFEPWSTVVYTVFRYEKVPGWWARYCDRPTLDAAQYEADLQRDSGGYDTFVTTQRVTYGARSIVVHGAVARKALDAAKAHLREARQKDQVQKAMRDDGCATQPKADAPKPAKASLPVLPCGCVPPCEGGHE